MKSSAIVFAIFAATLTLSAAHAASFIDKSKTVTCKDGSSVSSNVSLAKAICSCAKKGGAVGHSTKNCAKAKKN